MTFSREKVKELFLKAASLEPEKQHAYLEEACGSDEHLKAEVKSLLAHDITDDFLENSPVIRKDENQTPSTKDTMSAASHPELKRMHSAEGVSPDIFKRRNFFFSILKTKSRRIWTAAFFFVLLSCIGLWAYSGLRQATFQRTADMLQRALSSDVTALQIWIEERKAEAAFWAQHPPVRRQAEEIVRLWQGGASPPDLESFRALPVHERLTEIFRPFLKRKGSIAYTLSARTGEILSAPPDFRLAVGLPPSPQKAAVINEVFSGKLLFIPPQLVTGMRLSPKDTSVKLMFTGAAASIKTEYGQPFAALTLGMNVRKFTEILTAPLGGTGETYAFDDQGVMLSGSRFIPQLKQAGLLPDTPDAVSIRSLQVRDPGGNLTAGYQSSAEPGSWPLTAAVRTVLASRDKEAAFQQGILIEPYRNYLGIMTVCAWQRLPEFQIGIVTEISAEEAFAVMTHLKIIFGVMFALLAVFIGVFLFSSFTAFRLNEQVGEALKLGQYELEEQIGEGGMGMVYRARHAMLKRPTAVKIIRPDRLTHENLKRFEQEVRSAARLYHPNTIEIYDYGATPDGLFYYAMEFIPGIDLKQLIQMEGKLPAGRVVHILKQVCESLAEAHEAGIIHRDIKPHNIMLCSRGGRADVVKVLDFGLVKDLTQPRGETLTAPFSITGTLAYMAPERISSPHQADRRSDIYSLAAVGWFLLTGKKLFESEDTLELIHRILHDSPDLASDAALNMIPPSLIELLAECLEGDLDLRPADASLLFSRLDEISLSKPWSREDARRWWQKNFQS